MLLTEIKDKCPGDRVPSTFPNLKYFAKFVKYLTKPRGPPSFFF